MEGDDIGGPLGSARKFWRKRRANSESLDEASVEMSSPEFGGER